jgi:glycosyltransferase involved in cell wall biosynthesis
MPNSFSTETPIVSVVMVTYNHKSYLPTAIDSVLSQKGPFTQELIIADDASTDGTQEVIQYYADQFPSVIKPIYRNSNIGYQANYRDALSRCRGQYIAHLDGDDYWLVKNKLAKQLQLLQHYPDCSLCFGLCVQFYENRSTPLHLFPDIRGTRFSLADLLVRDFIPTCTVLYRATPRFVFPDWLLDIPSMDWGLWSILGLSGDFLFIPHVVGAYRKHNRGVWTSMSVSQRIDADEIYYRKMQAFLPQVYQPLVTAGLAKINKNRKSIGAIQNNYLDDGSPGLYREGESNGQD